ncbi:MAG: CoA transferase [Asgard group archaeon]|nr:CoA transferase [Asgard group archaeon]
MTLKSNRFLKNMKVLSVEQAVALPYCTWRLAVEGAEVIRIEPLWGDPNRKVGKKVLDEDDMNAYFMSVNSGKKGISLNLGTPNGQEILGELIDKLQVDIFACNQIPGNYKKLGIDYEKISSIKSDIIWVGVSGFGPDRSEPAYDPMIQAYSGIMDVNGEQNSPPLRFGVSIVDIEAGNQAYSEIMKALYLREKTGKGRRIDISMLDCSVSLLSLHIPLVSMGMNTPKTGNSHPNFAPVTVYKTNDGYISVAVGNEAQWKSMIKFPGFEILDKKEYSTNNDRVVHTEQLDNDMNSILKNKNTSEIITLFKNAKIPISKVNTIKDVLEDPYLYSKLVSTKDSKTNLEVIFAPPPVKPMGKLDLSFPPRFGEHNKEIYAKLGYNVVDLKKKGII